jgi:hypothetical protein
MKKQDKTYCETDRLFIREITKDTAKDIVIKNHYSHMWTKVSYAIGLFIREDSQHKFFNNVSERLIGVACYGDPIGRHCGASISTELDRTEVLELTRLFVFDGYGTNTESWFVGQTFRWLRRNAPHIKALISYSDPSAGHKGTVYQATNWIYQGYNMRPNETWLFRFEEDGKWVHARTIAPYWGTSSPFKIQTLIDKTFWIKPSPRKHRYIYILTDNHKERRRIMKGMKHPQKEYPKQVEAYTETIQRLDPAGHI